MSTELGDTGDIGDRRGILYPQRLPRFHRRKVTSALESYARWFWISQWALPEGERSEQRLLPFPAANLVIEREKVTLSGPATGVSTQVLTAQGWALGLLLRPAGLDALSCRPDEIVDRQIQFDVGELHAHVREFMEAGDVAGAVGKTARWMEKQVGQIAPGARLADEMVELAADDREITRVAQLAAKLGVSTRELQRVSGRYVGQSPLHIIRRYRLQEAALRLREDPGLTVAMVAAELGYSDQSHLASDFRTTLGFSARDYRNER